LNILFVNTDTIQEKTVERGTVSTGKKGSTSTYSCRGEKGRKEGGGENFAQSQAE